MGIVVNQSIKNTVITYLGFGIGAINVLFLFTKFIEPVYFGVITFILSTANIMMPLMAFGVHNTVVKFYSSFKTRQSQNGFLTLMLLLPFVVILPAIGISFIAFDTISSWLSKENPIIGDYTWYIVITAIAFAYFEVFYAWSKVQLQSVFGNFMKEVFHRVCTAVLLLLVYFGYMNTQQLIQAIVGVYVVRMLIMKLYAFSLRFPSLKHVQFKGSSRILKYTTLIIIAGSVANIILEIDKFMIGKYVAIENVAFYGVAIYIATVIGVPLRSMHQITYPLTAKLLNENNKAELKTLYEKSSLSLFIISGFIFLIILLNINQLYALMSDDYTNGLLIVFVIGLAKLYDNALGNNNAILFNSDYYRIVLLLGVLLAVSTVVLNALFIPSFGINGAAYASCITIFLYNTIKLVFVYFKFNMQPFTTNTLKTLLLISVSGLCFYFWEFPFHPILNIALKSLLLSVFYGGMVYRFNLSSDITNLINKMLRR
ncbi:lipopolysaccharide biosynthesis protein [Bizionia paragorgiae]|uniref:Membrane protein involved in the export of O-antigen and teichoic acid n=1 Tax=Bizionia paragorgiae TaxID=283786 RepID=A0A1H3X7N3_BIZPA|nr:polysaccharide biosynthesis C-terminal domain-containing protein [Bizionia paragorgiae]SDZ94644.1 Membrane protein involved in the export of O-antigen and teichoic acid [Bizionia paragorgiae]